MGTVALLECGGRQYAVTSDDRLWLLRAVQQEGKVAAEVAQALVNGFALNLTEGRDKTLREHVQEYSQPVNPSWYPDGSAFKHWHAIDPVKYPEAAAIKRRDVHSQRTSFDVEVVAAVELALTQGLTCIDASCTDYAAPWINAEKLYGAPLSDRTKDRQFGRNTLWTRKRSWQGYRVIGSA